MLKALWYYIKEVPEYWPAIIAGASILLIGAPLYWAIWYFLHRRKIVFPRNLQFAIGGVFVMFAGLAFLFASPRANQFHSFLLIYLSIACFFAAYAVVELIDIFVIQHYLINKRGIYISPPLRKIIGVILLCLAVLPILHIVLHFNPFTLVAIPTIATAGIALAFQDTLKAFIAGVGLGRMIRLGDWIGFQEKEGHVVDINWSRTVLRTLEGNTLYVPNNLLLTQPFINFSSHKIHRMMLKIGLSYSAPAEKVKQVMENCAKNLPGIAESRPPLAQILSLDTTVVYALYYWIEDYGDRLVVQDKLATKVWEAFMKERFEIPFPFPTYAMDEGFQPAPARKPT